LTYANQTHHRQLSRHAARPLLLRLAEARTEREDRGESRSERFRRLAPASTSPTPLEADLAALVAQGDLLGWLRAKGYRLPDEVEVLVPEAGACPDLVFRLDGANLAEAGYRLEDAGWDVVRFPTDADWDTIADTNALYFHLR
jgi:uncharacterized protein (DUF58 family)